MGNSLLDVPEALRVWHAAGWRCAFVGRADVATEGPAADASPASATQSRPAPAPRTQSAPVPDSRPTPGWSDRAAPQAAHTATPAPSIPIFGADPAAWPEPWRQFSDKVQRGAKIFITYPELCLDLTGQGDPARGLLWRKLIAMAATPRGTFAFWPCALPGRGGIEMSPDAFLHTLAHFDPAVVACFGPDTYRLISAACHRITQPAPSVLDRIRRFPDVSELVHSGDAPIRDIVHMLLNALTCA